MLQQSRFNYKTLCGATVATLITAVAATACASNSSTTAAHTSPTSTASSKLAVNQSLHDMLPGAIKSSGVITDGTPLDFPPYITQTAPGDPITGLVPALAVAMGQVLGVKIVYVNTVFDSIFPEMKAQKFDISWGVLSDTKTREQTTGADFIDYREAVMAFVYNKDAPVNGLAAACGKTVGILAGDLMIPVLESQSKTCVTQGKKGITVLQYPTTSDAKAQLVSGRIDAYLGDSGEDQLLASAVGNSSEFVVGDKTVQTPDLEAIAAPSSQPGLVNALLGAMQELKKDGVYDQLVKQYKAGGALPLGEIAINGARS